jgi:3'-5' exonuclease
MTPTLAFDIETVPDVEGLRKLHAIDLPDSEITAMASQLRRQRTGSDFLPLHLQRVVAIACALREGESFRVWSLGLPQDGEKALITRFYEGIEKYSPQLVSWNGCGFDLPVLHYRSLIHGVRAFRYWEWGDDDKDFRYNNYINRYHTRHIDLMDLLALYQPRNNVPLDQICKLCGLPGKMDMDGSKVWDAFQRGEIEAIRNYCETDAANTYLIFLRFQFLRGFCDESEYARECALVRTTLERSPAPHWREFVREWNPG